MGYTAEERSGSSANTGDGRSAEVRWLVQWFDDATTGPAFVDAWNFLSGAAAGTFNGLPLQSVDLTEVVESSAKGIWDGTSRYSYSKADEAAKPTDTKPLASGDTNQDVLSFNVSVEDRVEFNTSDGNGNLWIWDNVNSRRDPDFGADPAPVFPTPQEGVQVPQGLGWLGPIEGHQGLSIPRAVGSFAMDYYPDKDIVNNLYIKNVMDAVGKTNDVAWNAFDPKEVFLRGVTGESRSTADWRLSFDFAFKKNRTDIPVAGNIPTIPSAFGWDVIEVWYQKKEVDLPDVGGGSPGKEITKVAVQANVWTPFQSVDFQAILFPTVAPTP